MEFNIIFVLVAGAIIIAFFAGFITKYKDLQEEKLNAEVGMSIDQMISSLRGTTLYKNISTEIPFDLVFNCDSFTVNGIDQDLTGVVFASKNIKSDNILTWTKEWKYPFRIDDVIYFVDGNVKYYLESDPLNLLEEMPENIRNNFITSGDADVYVVFSLNNVNSFRQRGKVIYVNPNENEIKFYDINDEESSQYLSKEFVYGAIFAADFENYKCGYSKLMEKYENVRRVYGKKASSLNSIFPECNYNGIINSLNNGNNNEILFENNRLSEDGCEVVF